MTIALEVARRFTPWIACALLALVLAMVGPTQCRKIERMRAEARIGGEQGRAASANARDAVASGSAAAARERESDALTARNDKEIRNADGANVAVGDAVARAGIDGLCRRDAYRDSERCRLRGAAARPLAQGGARR